MTFKTVLPVLTTVSAVARWMSGEFERDGKLPRVLVLYDVEWDAIKSDRVFRDFGVDLNGDRVLCGMKIEIVWQWAPAKELRGYVPPGGFPFRGPGKSTRFYYPD